MLSKSDTQLRQPVGLEEQLMSDTRLDSIVGMSMLQLLQVIPSSSAASFEGWCCNRLSTLGFLATRKVSSPKPSVGITAAVLQKWFFVRSVLHTTGMQAGCCYAQHLSLERGSVKVGDTQFLQELSRRRRVTQVPGQVSDTAHVAQSNSHALQRWSTAAPAS